MKIPLMNVSRQYESIENEISNTVIEVLKSGQLHLQKVYEKLGYKVGDMPNSEELADCSLAIPMFPELKDDEQTYVIDAINKYRAD